MWGIDVSRYQGEIDWQEVTNQGIQFVIMKAMNEKTHVADPRFEYNYAKTKECKLAQGVYTYIIATNTLSAQKEAYALLSILQNRPLVRGIWLDMEDSKISSLSTNELTDIIRVESNIFKTAGYSVGIYSNVAWYNHILNGSVLINEYKWWMARYPREDNGTIRLDLKPKNNVYMWQYSSKGKLQGINGVVDLDIDVADLGKSNNELAKEVIQGKWGSGCARENRLTAAGYDYKKVQSIVNKLLKNNNYYPQYKGNSMKIDEVLKSIGVPEEYIGDKHKRIPVAEANGIEKYNGTLLQNLKLISLAKKGELKQVH